MKTINIKQLGQTLLGAASMALVLFSCTEGFAPDPAPDPTPGGGTNAPLEMVSVPLNLSVEASGGVSKAPRTTQWTEGAMDVELTEGPIEEPQGKALAGESAIINVWILQFAGTETTSKLILKTYLPGYVTNAKVELIKATAANRVVVLCNTFDLAFADGFTTNTTTYGQVAASAKMTRAVTASSGVFVSNGSGTEYIPMYGSYSGVISVGDASPEVISVVRTIAKVVLNVRNVAGLSRTYGELNVSVRDVPNVMSWIPPTVNIYPVSPTTVDFAAVEIPGLNPTNYRTATFWVPVNRRGTVTGTTGLMRVTNAPVKSTYLNMVTKYFLGWTLCDGTYKLHLGANFLTDYNVVHNTQYTYTVTLRRDLLGNDSRVSETVSSTIPLTVANPPAASDYVTIDGLKWAKGNLVGVNVSNAKVGASTDSSLYFHFGSLVGWVATNESSPVVVVKVKPAGYTGSVVWPAGRYTGGTAGTGYGLPATDVAATGIGDPCRLYLGAPWRTPTATEYSALFAGKTAETAWSAVTGWAWQATPAGAIGPQSLFFPASGYATVSYWVFGAGCAWSSSVSNAANGFSLGVDNRIVKPQDIVGRSNVLPVRCVSN